MSAYSITENVIRKHYKSDPLLMKKKLEDLENKFGDADYLSPIDMWFNLDSSGKAIVAELLDVSEKDFQTFMYVMMQVYNK